MDNRIAIETPEAAEFELELAGIGPRCGAWLIDLVIKGCIVVVMSLMALPFDQLGLAVMLLVMFVVLWMYGLIFEIFKNGQTPGKIVFKVRVVNRDGTPIGWYGSIIRNLVRIVDMLPFGYVTGVISMIISGRFQRLGDLAGDTVVVYHRGKYAIRDSADLPEVEPLRVPIALQPHEQEAIVDFAERSPALGRDRSAELAKILSPITDASTRAEAMKSVYGMAQRIVRWG